MCAENREKSSQGFFLFVLLNFMAYLLDLEVHHTRHVTRYFRQQSPVSPILGTVSYYDGPHRHRGKYLFPWYLQFLIKGYKINQAQALFRKIRKSRLFSARGVFCV